MTQQQRREIENALFTYPNNPNPIWNIVYEKVRDKYKWEKEETVLRLRYADKRQRYNICKEMRISKSVYYYYINRLLETAYLWAIELHLL